MLKPALLYAQEITRKFTEHLYTTDYFYYCGYCCGSSLPKIEEKDDLYQYAIVDSGDNVIGFLTYSISDYSDTVQFITEIGTYGFWVGESPREFAPGYDDFYHWYELGETVFLSREAAEQALKERENNE